MAPAVRNRVAAAILLVVAVAWCGLVYWTIPPGRDLVGPRAFPMFFGLALGALALLMFLQSIFGRPEGPEPPGQQPLPGESYTVVATIVAIAGYGFLLQPLGFLPATALAVVAVMVLILRIVNPLLVGAMALGLSLGCYVVFGKILGTYLPPGTWITIRF